MLHPIMQTQADMMKFKELRARFHTFYPQGGNDAGRAYAVAVSPVLVSSPFPKGGSTA